MRNLILISLLFGLIACSDDVEFSRNLTEVASETNPEPTPQPVPPTPGPSSVQAQEVFFQQAVGRGVDVLVVVDNSSSMLDEIKEMGRRFNSMMDNFVGLDWQLGVITTDSSGHNELGRDGRLDNFQGTNLRTISGRTPQAETLFRRTLEYYEDELYDCYNDEFVCPTNDEEALGSTLNAFRRRNSDNSGFFRTGTDLAVIYIGDEDELSNGGSGATEASEVLNEFNRTFGSNKNMVAYGIIIEPGDTGCFNQNRSFFGGGGASYATHINDLVQLTGGITGSICDSNYSRNLSVIGQNIRKNLLVEEVTLSRDPISGSVEVSLIPNAPNISYQVRGRRIIFNTPPPEATKIEIDYEFEE